MSFLPEINHKAERSTQGHDIHHNSLQGQHHRSKCSRQDDKRHERGDGNKPREIPIDGVSECHVAYRCASDLNSAGDHRQASLQFSNNLFPFRGGTFNGWNNYEQGSFAGRNACVYGDIAVKMPGVASAMMSPFATLEHPSD
jgi:hypothetical protein